MPNVSEKLQPDVSAADPPHSLSIIYPGVPDVALRKNRGSTVWQTRMVAAKAMREYCGALWHEAASAQLCRGVWPLWTSVPFPKYTVELVCHFWGKPLDYEGLASGMGPAIDAAIDAGLIRDDEPLKYCQGYSMRYEKAKSKDDARVEVRIREVA